ncbi:hypothetical protein F4810DRAFT_600442 [Camillea tinctor]|nr:hypothetical protein F4810DRAFT_600442 [Camillea tinctor]
MIFVFLLFSFFVSSFLFLFHPIQVAIVPYLSPFSSSLFCRILPIQDPPPPFPLSPKLFAFTRFSLPIPSFLQARENTTLPAYYIRHLRRNNSPPAKPRSLIIFLHSSTYIPETPAHLVT